jgi:hypothetical protein
LLLAVGNGLVTRRVTFLFLDSADKVGFPKPGVIFYPRGAGFFSYLIHCHGESPSYKKRSTSDHMAGFRVWCGLVILRPVENLNIGVFSFRMISQMTFPGVFPSFSRARLNNDQANVKILL